MSDTDRYQNAEEEVAQMEQEASEASRAADRARLAGAPFSDTAGKESTIIRAKLGEISKSSNMRTGHLADIPELAQSIRETGLLSPPLVRRTDSDSQPYELFAGFRRFAALELLDEAAGEAREWEFLLKEDLSPREALTMQFSENFHQSKPEPISFARAIRSIMISDPTLTAAEVSRVTGANEQWLGKALLLLDLEPVAALVESGDLSFTAADMVRKSIKAGNITQEEGEELAQKRADGEISAVELKHGVKGYVPPLAEDHDLVASQMDEARWAAQKGAKNDPNSLSVGADAEQADWDSGEIDSDPGFSNTSAAKTRPAAPAPSKGEDGDEYADTSSSQLMDQGDMDVPGTALDAYLLGRLLADVVSDEHMENLHLQPEGVYQWAFALQPDQVLGQLRNIALRMLSEDPAPPREIAREMQSS